MFPAGRITGAILTVAGTLGLLAIAYVNLSAIRAPGLVVFAPIAVTIALVAAFGTEVLRDRNLKAGLQALQSELSDFAYEISQRVAEIEVTRPAKTEGLEHDTWIEIQFDRRFKKRLASLLKEAIALGWSEVNFARTTLDLPFRQDSPIYWFGGTKIGVTRAVLNGIIDQIDLSLYGHRAHLVRFNYRFYWIGRRWLQLSLWQRHSFWCTLITWLIAASMIWFTLGFPSRHWPIR